MRPYSLGGAAYCVALCPSVCLSVRPVIERHVAPPSELQWHTCTFGHALTAAYRTAISAAQILVSIKQFHEKSTTKSNDLLSDFFRGQASRPLDIGIGIHLLKISWIITFSDAIRPTLPNMLLAYLAYVAYVRPNFGISGDLLSENEAKLVIWCSGRASQDAIDWSTLLLILPTLSDEEDVSAGRKRVLIA